MDSNENIRVVVVDDDPDVIDVTSEMLRRCGFLVVGKMKNAVGILDSIEELKPDLVLMDIDLGAGRDGLEATQSILKHFSLPIVIMTGLSPYELQLTNREKQLRESGAYTFLTKPLNEYLLHQTIHLAYQHWAKLMKQPKPILSAGEQTILLNAGSQFAVILVRDILYVESEKNYCTFSVESKKYTMRKTLKEAEQETGGVLVQVHKSFLVNLLHVESILPDFSEMSLKGGDKVVVGRSYRAALQDHYRHT